MNDEKVCTHTDQIVEGIEPRIPVGCEECLAAGDAWVSLRKCLICGHAGCCDSSPNKHATQHFKDTQHSIIEAYQTGDPWRWCYVDEMLLVR